MTEPGKYAPGLVGFPTPNTAADVAAYLLFLFPDPLWAQYILGACENLCAEYNWYEAGAMSPSDAAEAFRAIIEQAPYNLVGDRNIQAPFWDDTSGDDADDEADPDEQPWYGVWDGETFIESLSYWTVTAFLASGFGEGSAIQFITPLRTFRLTLRKNPHGAKLLVFMDSNIFQLVDLFGSTDEVVTVPIASPGTTLMLVNSGEHNEDATPDENGNYVCDVIRGRLAEEDVTPPGVRYSGTPPVYQTTTDGGTTWVDQPTADPRYNPAYKFPPLETYTGIECDTAARMSAQLKDCINALCAAGDAAQAVTALLELILLPGGLVGMLLSLLFTIADWIIDNGQATILAAFTDAVYDDLTCTLSCYIQPDGSISQTSLDAAWDKFKADHPGTIATVVDEIRFLFTDVVFSNAGTQRTETGDCSGCDACDWFVEYDFSLSPYGFRTLNTTAGVRGTYTGASFVATIQAGVNALFLYKAISGLELTGLSCYLAADHGTGIGNSRRWMDITVLSPVTQVTKETHGITSTALAWQNEFSTAFTTTAGWAFDFNCDSNGTGSIEVFKVRISGTGDPPADGVRVNSL